MNRKIPVVGRFLARMLMFSILFSVINNSNFVIKEWIDATLFIVTSLMKLLDMEAKVSTYYVSTSLAGQPFGFFIDWDCVGWKSMFFFLSLVLSCPSLGWKDFAKSFIFLPLLYILNILRIMGVLVIVDRVGIGHFDVVHGIMFGIVPTLYTLAAWTLWVKYRGNGL